MCLAPTCQSCTPFHNYYFFQRLLSSASLTVHAVYAWFRYIHIFFCTGMFGIFLLILTRSLCSIVFLHPFIYPSVFFCSSGTGSWGQHSKQRCPSFSLLCHFLQLLWGILRHSMASQERWSLQCFMGLPRGLHVVAMVSTPPHGDVREASRPDSTSNGSFRYGGAPSRHGLARGARASDDSGGETYCFWDILLSVMTQSS